MESTWPPLDIFPSLIFSSPPSLYFSHSPLPPGLLF